VRLTLRRTVLAAAAAVTLAAAVPASSSGTSPRVAVGADLSELSPSVPVPEQDPFFAVPSGLGDVRNGTVLRTRKIDLGWPIPATGWQILYKTLNHRNRPTATVTTVLVPSVPWLGAGPRPLLSYQVAEDGVAGKCAPSYALRAGVAATTSNSALEVPIITTAVLKGWTVAVPDYQGPRSLFLSAPMEAHGVLDGIRAVRNFRRLQVGRTTPVGMMGYSGGAYASSLAAQLQPTYAPGVRFTGVALGGLVARIRATIEGFNGSALGGAIPMGISSVVRAHPGARILDLLTPEGVSKVRASSHDCINDAVTRNPLFRIEPYEAVPHALDVPRIRRLLNRNSPLYVPGIPSAPIFHYHAKADEFAPFPPAKALTDKWCAAGVTVTRKVDVGEHLSGVATYALPALQYLADRYAGKPATNSCA